MTHKAVVDELTRLLSDGVAQMAALRQENEELKQELSHPTCADCGASGEFRGIEYPSTPNGAAEYDTECKECGSLNVAESAREAARLLGSALDTVRAELETERDAALAELSGIDAVLARRPALDKPSRRENIAHAISTAAKADVAIARVAELEAEANLVRAILVEDLAEAFNIKENRNATLPEIAKSIVMDIAKALVTEKK